MLEGILLGSLYNEESNEDNPDNQEPEQIEADSE